MKIINLALAATAFLALTTACTSSHETADNTVVEQTEQKDTPPIDEKARALYDKCSNLNDRDACFYLGAAYYNGERVKQDYSMSATYSEKACSLGSNGGCFNMGFLYEKGQGVRQNINTAKWYYGKACDFGYQKGCDNYRKLNERGY